MIALIKLIIVLVLSIFSGETTEEKITENSQYLELYQQQKIDMLTRSSKACLAS
ncbi:hypothetical protein [Gillisia sp. JM1]|uniref:hypothetical protein n=1 Tax=Gillisia sp. JM1 TaxID=1283286 RepID=UPI00040A04C5|nr:hypothetical protein [Gillisia sp. JM1]